jgi:hypothetical protein
LTPCNKEREVSDQEATAEDNVIRNDDGSAIYRLRTPVKFKGTEHTRCTVPALKGKHLMKAPFSVVNSDVELGALIRFANAVVLPLGIVEEMEPEDATAVASEVAEALGKSRKTGG